MIKDLIDRSFVVITVFKPRAASFPTLRVYPPANVKLASTAADIGHTPFFSDSTSLVANYSTNIGSTVAGYIMKAQFRSFSRPQEKDYHLMACPGYQKEKRQKENHPQPKGNRTSRDRHDVRHPFLPKKKPNHSSRSCSCPPRTHRTQKKSQGVQNNASRSLLRIPPPPPAPTAPPTVPVPIPTTTTSTLQQPPSNPLKKLPRRPPPSQ